MPPRQDVRFFIQAYQSMARRFVGSSMYSAKRTGRNSQTALVDCRGKGDWKLTAESPQRSLDRIELRHYRKSCQHEGISVRKLRHWSARAFDSADSSFTQFRTFSPIPEERAGRQEKAPLWQCVFVKKYQCTQLAIYELETKPLILTKLRWSNVPELQRQLPTEPT